MSYSSSHRSVEEFFMAQCLRLARLGEGSTAPNPMVGCVVLDARGRKVGEGWHQRAGEAHAEVVALDQAGDAARGGTLYVNLEPCNHEGRTPACTKRIIEAGIERVVCGTLDPNPLVSGQGRDELQNARISVRYGFLEEECLALNEVFFHYITRQKPFVSLKLGLTLDGKIAARNGQSRWITGALSRQYVHYLRGVHAAILTTAETVMTDNPQLTIRDFKSNANAPVRVVIDRNFRLKPGKHDIFENLDEQPTWVFTSNIHHNKDHASLARSRGVRVFEVDDTGLGLNMKDVFDILGREQISSVLVEAGGKLSGHLIREQLVNKLYLFYGPTLLPDAQAAQAFRNAGYLDLANSPKLQIMETRQIDGDLVVTANPIRKSTALTKA